MKLIMLWLGKLLGAIYTGGVIGSLLALLKPMLCYIGSMLTVGMVLAHSLRVLMSLINRILHYCLRRMITHHIGGRGWNQSLIINLIAPMLCLCIVTGLLILLLFIMVYELVATVMKRHKS